MSSRVCDEFIIIIFFLCSVRLRPTIVSVEGGRIERCTLGDAPNREKFKTEFYHYFIIFHVKKWKINEKEFFGMCFGCGILLGTGFIATRRAQQTTKLI